MKMVTMFDSFTPKTLKSFYQAFNEELSTDGDIDVYIDTDGGEIRVAGIVAKLLITHKDRIKIYLTGELSSCGFDLVYTLYKNGLKISITDTFYIAMIHKSSQMASISEVKYIKDYNEVNKKETYKMFKEIGFTKKDIENYENKVDIYISRDRFLTMFPLIKEEKLLS